MSYVATPHPVTPTVAVPAFRRGAAYIKVATGHGPFAQSTDGMSFTTEQPFVVADYATYAGLDVVTAQAVLDQAVIDGSVAVA
jgi:hypothetical protein